jgi:putative endonuclease
MNRFFLFRKFYELIWFLGFRPSLNKNHTKGWFGEWLASHHLQKKNYKFIAKNWRSSLDARREIDLIYMDGECLVFVEVRARSAKALNHGYFSITNAKKKTLLRACKDFLRLHRARYSVYRFDVIEIDLKNSAEMLFHHENVSLFP